MLGYNGENWTKEQEPNTADGEDSSGFEGLNTPVPLCSGHWVSQSPGSKSVPVLHWCQCQPETGRPRGSLSGSHHQHTAFPLAGPGLIWYHWWPPEETQWSVVGTLIITIIWLFKKQKASVSFERISSINACFDVTCPMKEEPIAYYWLCNQSMSL